MPSPWTTPWKPSGPGAGWSRAAGDGPYALTPLGADGHAAVAERIGVTRRRLMDGMTDEQYTETVRVLSRMAANLESASSAV
ncbi:hypothetical protein ABZU86_18885 [Streptomyces sp. NPDC005271]|uniref:hypothetical protein n=1 Tax=unclassified Streptomyces TaxID=2593676 RepID=UPI0033BCF99C